MHGLVYFALTHGVFSRKHPSECLSSATYRLAPAELLPAAGANDLAGAATGLRTTAGKIALGGGEGLASAAQLAGGDAATGGVTGLEGAAGGQILESSAGAISEAVPSGVRRLLNLLRRQQGG